MSYVASLVLASRYWTSVSDEIINELLRLTQQEPMRSTSMKNGSPTNKSSTPSNQLVKKIKMNKALHALAKLSPEKRAEIVKAEAVKRGLT